MCGRTACTLAADEICQACSRPSKIQSKCSSIPSWADHPGNKTYTPSTNIAPSCYTPILFRNPIKVGNKRSHNGTSIMYSDDQYTIMPMRWGLIPSFFKGASVSEFNYKTNNCRLEGIEDKKMYKSSLVKDQRCVVLCNGFYEWQTTTDSQNKQPFFIHAPQPNGIEIWNTETSVNRMESIEESKGPRLLMMAGLYSHWISSEQEEIYSYSVITMESGDNFSWMHHRVPAIFDTIQDVDNWLGNGTYKEKLSLLTNMSSLCWHEVSKSVNNSRNQDPSLMKPIQNPKRKNEMTSSQKCMSNWLKRAKSSPVQFRKDK